MDPVTRELLDKLCRDLSLEADLTKAPSAQFIVEIFTALTSCRVEEGLPPTAAIQKVIDVLGTDIIQTPLEHLKADEIVAGHNEAIYDLLEIFTARHNLRDDTLSVATSYDTLSRSDSSPDSLYSALSSLASKDSLLSSDESSCGSTGNKTACTTRTTCSDVTRVIDVPCFLCEYLAKHSLDSGTVVSGSDCTVASVASETPPDPTTTSRSFANNLTVPKPQIRTLMQDGPSRPSKLNRPKVQTVGQRLAQRRDVRIAALAAPKSVPAKEPVKEPLGRKTILKKDALKKSPEKTQPSKIVNEPKNVIIAKRVPLNPKNIPPPSNSLEQAGDLVNDEDVDEEEQPELSPHMTRVLRKQYSQHLQWMSSHGASQGGLTKLEREYEDLIEKHSLRMKQMRKEACSANRVALVQAHKGIAQTVRNLKTHARTQACQLAHSQLEADRLQRAKEAKLRQAEEKLLRETFAEAMRIQKEQLLDFKKQMASQRLVESDKHQIYMQGLEHFYRSQLDMLGETLSTEFKNGEMRNSAQMALLRGMRKELKEKLNKEVAFLKELVFLEDDDR